MMAEGGHPFLQNRAGDGIRTRDEGLEGPSVTTTPRPQMVVGAAGFEPATSWPQTKRATGLRYAPEAYIF